MLAALLMAASLVLPTGETEPVRSLEDAADDAAIWINPDDPADSLILGTDKQAGLRVYGLDGAERQFLAAGRLNNVDLVQGVRLGGERLDLVAASNRTDDSVTLFTIANGRVRPAGRFSVGPEPYGLCLGQQDGRLIIFVAHKQGYVQPYHLTALQEDPIALRPAFFASQIEGCVYDPVGARLFVGEEAVGVWSVPLYGSGLAEPGRRLIAQVGGPDGLAADVEGLTIYRSDLSAVLLVSSQGDDSLLAYRLAPGFPFLAKIEIGADLAAGIDGAQETDGIAAVSAALGPALPEGLLVVQDGFNVDPGVRNDGRTANDEPLAPQNFKLIDWRKVRAAWD